MKLGFRIPSLKKSLKARTTGKLKRTVKKTINPVYGTKGMGLISNPKKSIYNSIYNKTTIGINDILDNGSESQPNISSANKIRNAKYNDLNVRDESLDRLINGELPWGWLTENSEYIKPKDDKLYDLSSKASNAENIDEEIALLKEFIEFYYEYKEECIAKGECFKKYFSDMYMKCFNSQNKRFEFVTPRKERLKYLKDNYDKLIQEEKQRKEDEIKKQSLMENIEEKIEDIVKNNPGILQSDLYQKFDPILKDEISTIVYFWARENKISREKSGRTYKLYFN